MSGHFRYDNLLRVRMPKVVNPETPLRVTRVTTVFDMPVGSMTLSLPIQVELVVTTMCIADSVFDHFLAKAAFSAIQPSIATVVRQPN